MHSTRLLELKETCNAERSDTECKQLFFANKKSPQGSFK